MAISGSFYGTTSNGAIKPKITWSAQENLEGNYSQVTATLSYSRTDSYMTYGHWAGTLTINGEQKSVSGKYVEITKNSNTVTITHTVQVPHNDDGTKTVTISASGSISGTTLTKTSISAAVTLVNIPRAATVAATDADIGSVSTVTIGKKSDQYTYTVAYQFGSLKGYLTEKGLSQAKTYVKASSLAFTLPEDFYYEIPESQSGLCKLTCTTYLADSPIGTPQQCSFTVRADPAKCGPQLSVSVVDVNGKTLVLTGDQHTFIRYLSSARCTMTAQARYGASITQKKIAGKTVTADTLTVEEVEADSIRFSAKDSRGYTTQTTVALGLLPYFLPVLRLRAARTDATSGDAVLQIDGSFYNASFGKTANSLQLQFQLEDGSSISLKPQTDGNNFQAQQPLQGLDYTRAYSVKVTATDGLSSQVVTARINPGIPLFDWGKADFTFHVPVSLSGSRLQDLAEPAASSDAATKAYTDSNFLKNKGTQTLDGNLIVEGNGSANQYWAIDSTDDYPRLVLRDANGNNIARMHAAVSSNRIYFYSYSPDGASYSERYRLPAPDNVSANVNYDIMTSKTHGIKKLWENASPTSAFAAQTVSVDLSGYDGVMVTGKFQYNGADVRSTTGFIPVGQSGHIIVSNQDNANLRYRRFTVSKTGVAFETGINMSTGATSTNLAVPVVIYGIKGVS